MLYGEFVEGTGCRETEHNYSVYKRVEALYMVDDAMSKEDAYAIGKLWIDNSLTDEEIAHNNEVYAEIEEWDNAIRKDKERIADAQENLRELKEKLKLYKEWLVQDEMTLKAVKEKLIVV